jgi:hypothetical protein
MLVASSCSALRNIRSSAEETRGSSRVLVGVLVAVMDLE